VAQLGYIDGYKKVGACVLWITGMAGSTPEMNVAVLSLRDLWPAMAR
jgi:hypothetical protein